MFFANDLLKPAGLLVAWWIFNAAAICSVAAPPPAPGAARARAARAPNRRFVLSFPHTHR